MKESDILYQNGIFWVCGGERGGFEVYQELATVSRRKVVIGYEGKEGLARAITWCDKLSEDERKAIT